MKLYKYVFASALIAIAAFGASAKGLLGIPGESSTSIGVYVKDLSTGKVLVSQSADIGLTPASTMKAITTASALSIIGPNYKFHTPVRLVGHRHGATWHGDLVIISSGDPTVESENFKSKLGFCDSIVAGLRRIGISDIEGEIVIKEFLSDAGPIAQWEIEDVAWPYGAGLYGMNYKDNSFIVYPATKETRPHVPGLKVTVKKARGVDVARGIYSNHLVVWGPNPADKKWAVKTTMPEPALVLGYELAAELKKAGINVRPRDGELGEGLDTARVYDHYSARSSDIMKSLMVRSDNLFAEGMLRSISPDDTRSDAIKREKALWVSRGLNEAKDMIINDGSGLTRANRLSARFIGDVLEWMAKSKYADSYVSFFPRAGLDGTMKAFAAKTPLKGRLAFKTGSVSSVQCYAGYKLDSEGKPTHVVVVLVNGFSCRRPLVKTAVENLMLKLFE